MVGQQVAGQSGGQDLAAVGDRRDPRRPVDAEPDQALPGLLGGPRMEAHPDPDRRVVGPRFREERALPRDRRLDRGRCLGEDDEEGVALGALLDAAVRRPRLAQERAVPLEERPGSGRGRSGPRARWSLRYR